MKKSKVKLAEESIQEFIAEKEAARKLANQAETLRVSLDFILDSFRVKMDELRRKRTDVLNNAEERFCKGIRKIYGSKVRIVFSNDLVFLRMLGVRRY